MNVVFASQLIMHNDFSIASGIGNPKELIKQCCVEFKYVDEKMRLNSNEPTRFDGGRPPAERVC